MPQPRPQHHVRRYYINSHLGWGWALYSSRESPQPMVWGLSISFLQIAAAKLPRIPHA